MRIVAAFTLRAINGWERGRLSPSLEGSLGHFEPDLLRPVRHDVGARGAASVVLRQDKAPLCRGRVDGAAGEAFEALAVVIIALHILPWHDHALRPSEARSVAP